MIVAFYLTKGARFWATQAAFGERYLERSAK